MPDNKLINLIKVQLAFGAGSTRAFAVFNELINGGEITGNDKNKISKIENSAAQKVIDDCDKNGIEILPIYSPKFPEVLRNITAPPLILYTKGNLPDFDNDPTVCIVGPRKISKFGEKAAYSLARRLVKAGITVISGGALGGDTAAHKGALSAEGKTVAVLGCGICYDYLPENRGLRNEIQKHGALISEYPPYFPTSRYSFPVRNRLMSALSFSTVVVEAGEKSGTLITARTAAEQGKDVFVIPGNPTDNFYKGSNALLRDGATPLLDASDIFNLYIPRFAEKIDLKKAFSEENSKNNKKLRKKSNISLSKSGEMVYNNIVKEKFIADDFLSLNLSGDELLSALTELEIEGLVKSLPGGIYELV